MGSSLFETLLLVGVACVIAAVVGGGLKLAQIELPVVSSQRRQVILAGLGVALILFDFAVFKPGGVDIRLPRIELPIDFPWFFRPPTITLSRASGPPGTSVTVRGTGFAAGERLRIYLHLEELGSATADADGAFSTVVQIPSGWLFRNQQFDIRVRGEVSRRSTHEPFRVT